MVLVHEQVAHLGVTFSQGKPQRSNLGNYMVQAEASKRLGQMGFHTRTLPKTAL